MYVSRRGAIGDSAYIHELGHCYHRVILDRSDPKHEDKEWWTFVFAVELEVRKRGW